MPLQTAQELVVRARGLFTNPNPLSEVPDGAMAVADNIVIDRDGLVQPRRGFPQVAATFGTGAAGSKNVFYRNTRVISYQNTNQGFLAFYTGSLWVQVDSSADAIDWAASRLRFAEGNQNLYYCTSHGIRKIDSLLYEPFAGVVTTARAAGLGKAMDPLGLAMQTAAAIGGTGFLPDNTAVAYRAVIAQTDFNGNRLRSSVSGRAVVRNTPIAVTLQRTGNVTTVTAVSPATFPFVPATGDTINLILNAGITNPGFTIGIVTALAGATSSAFTYTDVGANIVLTTGFTANWQTRPVTMTVPLPYYATNGMVLELYRSKPSATAGDEPDDELALIFQYNLTSADITAVSVSVTDIQPTLLRGEALYTNASQDTILGSNEPPPWAKDVALFRNSMFYANTRTKQRFLLTLLAVGGTSGLQTGDSLNVGPLILTAGAAQTTTGGFVVETGAQYTVSQQIERTARNFVQAINQYDRTRNLQVQAYYLSGPSDPPGKILIEAQGFGVLVTPNGANPESNVRTDGFPVFASAHGAAFNPPLVPRVDLGLGAITSISRVGNTVSVQWTASFGAAFKVGDVFWDWSTTQLANFPHGLRQVLTVNLNADTITYQDDLNVSDTVATPVINFAKPSAISANTPAANRLYYSKTGQPEAVPDNNFMELGSKLAAILRIIPMRESLYVLKEDGVFRITGEDPTTFIGRQFDSTVRCLAPETLAQVGNMAHFYSNQGVVELNDSGVQIISRPIESTFLALYAANPTNFRNLTWGVGYESDHKYILGTISAAGDTQPTQIFVYNLLARAWTRWPISKLFGAMDPINDVLEFVEPATNKISSERKTFTSADQQDNTGVAIATSVQWVVRTGGHPGLLKQFVDIDFMFGSPSFTTANAYFSSEISQAEDSVTLTSTTGSTNPVTQRTLVTRDKQVCSLLNIRFAHAVAGETWSIRGITVNFIPLGEQLAR